MQKATPVEMRKCLLAVDILKAAGIRFVPMPVLSDEDNDFLAEEMRGRLEQLVAMCENQEG